MDIIALTVKTVKKLEVTQKAIMLDISLRHKIKNKEIRNRNLMGNVI